MSINKKILNSTIIIAIILISVHMLKIKKSRLAISSRLPWIDILNKLIEKEKKDPTIVVGLKMITSDRWEQTCPYGYQMASGCQYPGCNLKHHVWYTKYIYLCQKKARMSEMEPEDKIFNQINAINNENCESPLSSIGGINLNEGKSVQKQFLCAGFSKDFKDSITNQPLAPISDVFINVIGISSPVPEGYFCNDTDINLKLGGKYVYICYYHNIYAPMKVELLDFQFLESNSTKSRGDISQTKLREIENDNSGGSTPQTVKDTTEYSFTEEYSMNY
jgi:hypothetical protein